MLQKYEKLFFENHNMSETLFNKPDKWHGTRD